MIGESKATRTSAYKTLAPTQSTPMIQAISLKNIPSTTATMTILTQSMWDQCPTAGRQATIPTTTCTATMSASSTTPISRTSRKTSSQQTTVFSRKSPPAGNMSEIVAANHLIGKSATPPKDPVSWLAAALVIVMGR